MVGSLVLAVAGDSVPYLRDFSLGLLEVLVMSPASPRSADPGEGKAEASVSFMTLPWPPLSAVSTVFHWSHRSVIL